MSEFPVADRYFARFLADRVPFALLRRHATAGAQEDQVLREVDDWVPDTRGSVSRAIVFPLDSDLEEITAAEAEAVQRMVADREYRPLSKAPAVTPWEAQGCAVCRRQWETSERPQFLAENAADHSALYRCTECRTWWLLSERAAAAVQADDIRPNYHEYLSD